MQIRSFLRAVTCALADKYSIRYCGVYTQRNGVKLYACDGVTVAFIHRLRRIVKPLGFNVYYGRSRPYSSPSVWVRAFHKPRPSTVD